MKASDEYIVFPVSIKIICENRKARFHYEILEIFEAGLMLQGSEVKSLRNGGANIGDAYGMINKGEAFLFHAHIAPYKGASHFNHEPLRIRKLLLHRHELDKLVGRTVEKGLNLVPLKMYFKKGIAKVELGLGKSKKKGDKRAAIKKRDTDRDLRRMMKR